MKKKIPDKKKLLGITSLIAIVQLKKNVSSKKCSAVQNSPSSKSPLYDIRWEGNASGNNNVSKVHNKIVNIQLRPRWHSSDGSFVC